MSGLVGVILAGGRARRMGGGDKALRDLGGLPLAARVRDRLAPQVARLALNANGDAGRFAGLGLPVIADDMADAGPLAGVLAGLDWAAELGAEVLLTAPADTPFLPRNLAARLGAAGILPAFAQAGRRSHPAVALWPVTARSRLRDALQGGVRKVTDFTDSEAAVGVPFDETTAFFNVNTPEDLALAEGML